jgi:hypothetical protein
MTTSMISNMSSKLAQEKERVAKQSNALESLQRSTEVMAAKLQSAEGEKAAYKVTFMEQGQHTCVCVCMCVCVSVCLCECVFVCVCVSKLQSAEGEKAAYKGTVTEQGQHTHSHALTPTLI